MIVEPVDGAFWAENVIVEDSTSNPNRGRYTGNLPDHWNSNTSQNLRLVESGTRT